MNGETPKSQKKAKDEKPANGETPKSQKKSKQDKAETPKEQAKKEVAKTVSCFVITCSLRSILTTCSVTHRGIYSTFYYCFV